MSIIIGRILRTWQKKRIIIIILIHFDFLQIKETEGERDGRRVFGMWNRINIWRSHIIILIIVIIIIIIIVMYTTNERYRREKKIQIGCIFRAFDSFFSLLHIRLSVNQTSTNLFSLFYQQQTTKRDKNASSVIHHSTNIVIPFVRKCILYFWLANKRIIQRKKNDWYEKMLKQSNGSQTSVEINLFIKTYNIYVCIYNDDTI